MNGQANGSSLIHQRPFNGLTNPPGGVGRKAITQLRIKFFYRPHKPQIALLNKIEKLEAAIDVASGYFNHQPQIALNHSVSRCFTTFLKLAGVVNLFVGRQQRRKANFF